MYLFPFLEVFFAGILRVWPIFGLLLIAIVVNGLVIGRIEGWRRGDALYHAFINATTVGYGDFRPATGWGKVLAILNVFMGLLFTAVFVGTGVYAVEQALSLP